MTFSSYRAPILLRPRNFQWYWNSDGSLGSSEGEEQWQKYTDVENEIIEDAYNEKKSDVEIDCEYVINFQQQIQYQKHDKNRQHRIKRVQLDIDRSNIHLREERFSLPVTFVPLSPNQDELDGDALILLRNNYLTAAYGRLEIHDKNKTFASVVEDAAQGLIKEGNMRHKTHEAHWLARQLLAVKHCGINTKVKSYHATDVPIDIGQTCVYLYTKESFWYKLINQLFRDPQKMSIEQLKIVGPFCWLLHLYISTNQTPEILKVYRGLNLVDEQREEFMKDKMIFTSFTSTTRNRELAEWYGNTLLIFDLDVKFNNRIRIACGMDISALSNFPEEEEFLVFPSSVFYFVKYEYDTEKKKHIIHLRKAEANN